MYSLILPGTAVLSVTTIHIFLIRFAKTMFLPFVNRQFIHALWNRKANIFCCAVLLFYISFLMLNSRVHWCSYTMVIRNRTCSRWFLLSCLITFWQCLELITFLMLTLYEFHFFLFCYESVLSMSEAKRFISWFPEELFSFLPHCKHLYSRIYSTLCLYKCSWSCFSLMHSTLALFFYLCIVIFGTI